jgi:hypothetical protein
VQLLYVCKESMIKDLFHSDESMNMPYFYDETGTLVFTSYNSRNQLQGTPNMSPA